MSLIEETYVMVHHLGFSRDDVMQMPTFERRKYLELFGQEIERKKELMDGARTNSSSGRGRKTISGDALKSKMRNGEIN